MAQNIEIVFAPDLYRFHQRCSTVVLIDVARFTSTLITALANGAISVEAYHDEDTPLKLKREKGYIIAGEFNGEDLEGFDFNNSPISMSEENVSGKQLAFVTTNGTYARSIIYDYETILAGAFLNTSALCKRLIEDGKSVALLCSGRRRKPCCEDIVFAGKVAENLLNTGNFSYTDDSVALAIEIYHSAKADIRSYVLSHAPSALNHYNNFPAYAKDFDFVFQNDLFDIVPEETDAFKFEIKR